MAMSSYEIAALTGGFNQQTMVGMQHSSMISQQFGGYQPNAAIHPTPTQGENLTAQLMNFGTGAGMNALSRPGMNQGFMGGMSAMGRGVLGQVNYGIQQQQMMDASMRQAFRHQNQFGGAGFTPTQLGGMQRDMMQMAQQRGPGGEQVTMEELGRLAQNMGRMGMSESVRSVKDFNEKFGEMLKTVKEVAQTLGTSLEEAQKVMTSMRGSGVFGMGTQAAQLKQMARGAFAGGQHMSMAELSGAGLIGSQISRSIGGSGLHGQMAGVEAMTQVGVMRNMGLIGEQDIYQQTGLSGAEGRQALMQQQLGQDAKFLKSRHGRYFLASMMGEGGQIDQSSVQAMLAGGVSASDVYGKGRGRVNQNVHGFLRNEGRLRGQALAMGGGNLRASFYAMELQRRGFDLSGDDDRGMLALQKIGGMNREESEFMMNKIRNLGRMQTFREEMSGNQEYYQQLEQQERKASPEDMVKDVEMAKQRVNNELRKFGADLYKSWSAQVDGAVKKMSGQFERRINRNLASTVRALERGGPGGRMAMEQDLGMGTAGEFGLGMGTASALAEQNFGGRGPATGRRLDRAIFGRYNELQGMGVDLDSIKTGTDLQQARLDAARTASAFRGAGTDVGGISQEFTDQFNEQMAVRRVEGRGPEFLKNFGKALETMEGKEAEALRQRWKAAKTPQERAALAKGILNKTGNGGLFQDRVQSPGMMQGFGLSDFGSTEEANMVLGRKFMSGMNFDRVVRGQEAGPDRTASDLFGRGRFMLGRDTFGGKAAGWLQGQAKGMEDWMGGGVKRGTIEGITGAPRSAVAGIFGEGAGKTFDQYLGGAQQDITNQLYGQLGGGASAVEMSQVMEAMRSDETFDDLLALQSGDAKARADTRRSYTQKMRKLQQGDLDKPSNQIEMARVKGVLMTDDYNKYKREHGGKEPPASWYKKRAQHYGVSEAELKGMMNMTLTATGQTQAERTAQVYSDLGERAQQELVNIEKEVAAVEKSDASEEVKAFARKQRDFTKRKAEILRGGKVTADDVEGMQEQLRSFQEDVNKFETETSETFDALSLEEQMQKGQEMTQFGGPLGARGRRMVESAGIGMGLQRARKRGAGGEKSFIAAQLGVGISAKAAAGMDADELAKKVMADTGLASASGVSAERKREFQKQLSAISGDKDMDDKEKGRALADLRRNFSASLTTASREQQEKKARGTDPSYRMMERINQTIKDIKDQGILNELQNINTTLKDQVKE